MRGRTTVVHGTFHPPRDPALVLNTDDFALGVAVDRLVDAIRAWVEN